MYVVVQAESLKWFRFNLISRISTLLAHQCAHVHGTMSWLRFRRAGYRFALGGNRFALDKEVWSWRRNHVSSHWQCYSGLTPLSVCFPVFCYAIVHIPWPIVIVSNLVDWNLVKWLSWRRRNSDGLWHERILTRRHAVGGVRITSSSWMSVGSDLMDHHSFLNGATGSMRYL